MRNYFVAGAVLTAAAFTFGSAVAGCVVGLVFFLGAVCADRPQLIPLHGEGARGDDTFRVLTFNILLRPLVHNVSDDRKNERLARFIEEHLPRYSIVCLQEMFGALSFRQRRLLEGAAACGFSHAAVGGSSLGKIPLLDAGLVILSRYPIVETDAHHYTRSALIDAWAPKMILWALVRIPLTGRYLHVFNTHMQSTHTGWEAEGTLRARAAQVEEWVLFVRRKMTLHPHTPAFLCGDLNMDARRFPLDYDRMMELLRRELPTQRIQNLMPPPFPVTYGVKGERALVMEKDWDCEACLDYALLVGECDGAGRVVEEGEEALSDHRGIEATLNFI